MTEKEEQKWIDGNKAGYRDLLGHCVRALHDEDTSKEALILQLEDIKSSLRSLCEEFGDNDWDDDLHLADVINKHLGNHLHTQQQVKNTVDLGSVSGSFKFAKYVNGYYEYFDNIETGDVYKNVVTGRLMNEKQIFDEWLKLNDR